MRPSTRIGRTCFLAVQILVILVILCPILYALDISFLPLSQIFGKPLKLIPHEPDLSYYVTAFQRAPLFRYLVNTVIIAVAALRLDRSFWHVSRHLHLPTLILKGKMYCLWPFWQP